MEYYQSKNLHKYCKRSTSRTKALEEAIAYVREGDTLVVWKLDRLARSLKHLIETITNLNNRKIGFKSLTENIDTATSGGKLIFRIFGALANLNGILSESERKQNFKQPEPEEEKAADQKRQRSILQRKSPLHRHFIMTNPTPLMIFARH